MPAISGGFRDAASVYLHKKSPLVGGLKRPCLDFT